jgi:hypothetical protein
MNKELTPTIICALAISSTSSLAASITAEISQLCKGGICRSVALGATEGLNTRITKAMFTYQPLVVPSGTLVLGRIFNVTGTVIDRFIEQSLSCCQSFGPTYVVEDASGVEKRVQIRTYKGGQGIESNAEFYRRDCKTLMTLTLGTKHSFTREALFLQDRTEQTGGTGTAKKKGINLLHSCEISPQWIFLHMYILMGKGGGDGGHNRLKDLSNIIGKDFNRLKMCVSHPGIKNEVTNWVLGKFTPKEAQLLEDLYKKIIVHKDKVFKLEIENLQNLVN